MTAKLEIPGVTADAMDRLRVFPGRDGLQADGDSGTVVGKCIDVAYRYDPTAALLEVDARRLPEHLQDTDDAEPLTALRSMLETALQSAPGLPSHCGVYTYALVTIDNQSGGILTYGGMDSLNHGQMTVNNQHIDAGKTSLSFTCESTKGSTFGVDGTAKIGLADGQTSMYIKFHPTVELRKQAC